MQQNFVHNQPRTHFRLLPYYSANYDKLLAFTIYSGLLDTFVILLLDISPHYKLWKSYLLLTDKSNSTLCGTAFSHFPAISSVSEF